MPPKPRLDLPSSDIRFLRKAWRPGGQNMARNNVPASELPESQMPGSQMPDIDMPESQMPGSEMLESEMPDHAAHRWRPRLKGNRVPSSLANSSYKPEMGDPISFSGNLSQGYVQRQRQHRLLGMPNRPEDSQGAEQLGRDLHGHMEEDGLPELAEDELPVAATPSRMSGVYKIPAIPPARDRGRKRSDGGFLRDVESQQESDQGMVAPQTPVRVAKRAHSLLDSEGMIPQRTFPGQDARDFRRVVESEASIGGYRYAGEREYVNISSGAHQYLRGPSHDSLYDMTPGRTNQYYPAMLPRAMPASHMASSPPVRRAPHSLELGGRDDDLEADGDELEEEGLQAFDARMEGCMRYDYALKHGCVAAVVLAREHATRLGHPLVDNMDEAEWRETGKNVLWSMSRELLDALVIGSIAKEAASATSSLGELFSSESVWSVRANIRAPLLYSLGISASGSSRAKGSSPSPREWRSVIQVMRRYVSLQQANFKEALAIDNAFRERSDWTQIAQGKHRFLSKERDGERRRVRGRIETVKQFCDAFEVRLNAMPDSDQDRPLQRPPQYIGYAFFFSTRWKSHARGDTAFLLHLAHSIIQHLLPGMYTLDAFPLCFLAHEIEARLGELLLTLLADSFSSTGGGFNAHPPGLNNASADMVNWTKLDTEKFWAECKEFREEMNYWEVARVAEMAVLEQGKQASENSSDAVAGTQRDKWRTLQEEKVQIAGRLNVLWKEQEEALKKQAQEGESALSKEALQGTAGAKMREIVARNLKLGR